MEQTLISTLIVALEVISKGMAQGNAAVMQQFSKSDNIDGFVSSTGINGTVYARSMTECGIRCVLNNACTSFFYTTGNSTCLLQDLVHNGTTGLQPSPMTVYFVAISVPAVPFTCPTDDLQFRTVLLDDGTTLTYRVFKTKKSYSESELECNNFGGHLLQVLTDSRNTFTQNLLMCTGYYGIADYWLDGSNLAASDYNDLTQWITSDGQILPSQYWDSTQPNGPTTDHCVAMYEAYSFKWADRPCSYLNNYICEL